MNFGGALFWPYFGVIGLILLSVSILYSLTKIQPFNIHSREEKRNLLIKNKLKIIRNYLYL